MRIGIHGIDGKLEQYLNSVIIKHEFVRYEHPLFDTADIYFLKTNESEKNEIFELKKILKLLAGKTKPPIYILNHTIPKTIDSLRKFTKLKLYPFDFSVNENGQNILFLGIDKNEDMDNEKLLCDIFTNIGFYKFHNRDLEAARYFALIYKNFHDLFQTIAEKYCKRILGTPEFMLLCCSFKLDQDEVGPGYLSKEYPLDKNRKRGFGGAQNLSMMLAMINEFKRLGLQAGFLEAMFQENMVYRSCFDDDLPSLEITMPELTRQKIASKSGADNKA